MLKKEEVKPTLEAVYYLLKERKKQGETFDKETENWLKIYQKRIEPSL